MRPYPVTFHLYAESDEEVRTLQSALYDLVTNYYNDGVYVTAERVTDVVKKVNASPFLKSLL